MTAKNSALLVFLTAALSFGAGSTFAATGDPPRVTLPALASAQPLMQLASAEPSQQAPVSYNGVALTVQAHNDKKHVTLHIGDDFSLGDLKITYTDNSGRSVPGSVWTNNFSVEGVHFPGEKDLPGRTQITISSGDSMASADGHYRITVDKMIADASTATPQVQPQPQPQQQAGNTPPLARAPVAMTGMGGKTFEIPGKLALQANEQATANANTMQFTLARSDQGCGTLQAADGKGAPSVTNLNVGENTVTTSHGDLDVVCAMGTGNSMAGYVIFDMTN